jgi:sugar phosphate isomerase/epimerase
MRVGLDTFTIRELGLSPVAQLEFIRERGLEGAQFGGLGSLSASLDPGEIAAVREAADALGLYSHVSVSSPNPHNHDAGTKELRARLTQEIELAAACDWHELHSALGSEKTRYQHELPWRQHLADSTAFLKSLAPVLRANGSRINLETHGDTTTFELVRLVEEVGADVAGICLDTANVLCFAEDPVAAARRAAPYTHLTHSKDAIIYFCENGLRRQGRPPGEGILDWEKILAVLGEFHPDLPLSIEDHKWLFDAEIFDPDWHAQQADLTREELASTMKLAWEVELRIRSGEIPLPEEYEAIPYVEQLEARLASGRDYLKELTAKRPSSSRCAQVSPAT